MMVVRADATFAQTWSNVAGRLGVAADAYRGLAGDVVDHLRGAGSWASGISTGLGIAATIVQAVHDLVRDTLSQLVGSIISWAAELAATVGLATPVVVEQVATRVASLAEELGTKITKLITSCKNLGHLIDDLKALFRRGSDLFDGLLHGARSADGPEPRATGAASSHMPRDPVRRYDWADGTYSDLRADPSLASTIAKHTGMDPGDVRRGLDNFLVDEHPIRDPETGQVVTRAFDSSPEQAEAVLRLREGQARPADLVLLLHEIAEADYFAVHPGCEYREAHRAANAVADWESLFEAGRL